LSTLVKGTQASQAQTFTFTFPSLQELYFFFKERGNENRQGEMGEGERMYV
jgi:hypothetical protein